jgi:hypothetical protein
MEKTKLIKRTGAVILGTVVILILCFVGKFGEDVSNEKIVVNQFPFSGKMAYWTTPGWKWQGWGKTTEYFKTSQLWFGSENEKGEQIGNPIKVIFNVSSQQFIFIGRYTFFNLS